MFCPVCDSKNIQDFIIRDNVPVYQNLVFRNRDEAIKIVRGTLDLKVCIDCSFVFNNSFEPEKLIYDESYENTQTYSPFFKKYIDDLVDYLIKEKEVRNSVIAEIGCGKGYFIRNLLTKDSDNKGYGFDLSYQGNESELDKRLIFKKKYLTSEDSEIKPDVVICRHVIEHISEPLKFLGEITGVFGKNLNLGYFFETPCIEWIVKNVAFWDFFYEHCSYFNYFSLSKMFEKNGCNIDKIFNIFQGQYLWLETTSSIKNNFGESFDIKKFIKSLQKYSSAERKIIGYWKSKIYELSLDGKTAIWGAGAKGVTFVNLIDPENKYIDYVVDLNPAKQENYISGTGHKIIDYIKLDEFGVKNIILMNPNYYYECKELLDSTAQNVKLIPL